MLESKSMNRKWLFVATAHCGFASAAPALMLKPLATYAGLPLDSEPTWWIVLAAVVTAGLVLWLTYDFRRQGASRIVAWGPVVFLALSQLLWFLFFKGVAAVGAPAAGLEADASLSWPLWMLSNGLFVGASFAGASLTKQQDPAPPSRYLMVASWAWVGIGLLVTAFAAQALLSVRDILKDVSG